MTGRILSITVDLTPTVQNHAGLGRYAEEIARALFASCQPDERMCAFYTDPHRRRLSPPLDQLPASTLTLPNKLWRSKVMLAYALHLPQNQAIGQPDVFFATDHLLPYLPGAIKHFLLADLSFLSHSQTHTFLNRTFLQLMVPRFLRAADAVIAISQCTLQEALSRYPFIGNKGYVAHPGVGQHFRPVLDPARLDSVRARYHLPERFVLYVGTIEPRKNLVMLLGAFRQASLADLKLVIVGKRGWLFQEALARVHELGLEDQVIWTGFVPDDDLPALYSLAQVFAYPSLFEGFGLPVAEAMACGTPVLCSNTSSLPEVAGDAALLLPPTDVCAWSQALVRIVQDVSLHADLRERGLRQAKRFTWEASANLVRALYRELYARHP